MKREIMQFFLFIFCWPLNTAATKECQTWFENAGIKKGKDCLIECSIISTDMGTFDCPNLCAKLCEEKIEWRFMFNLSYLYFTLTEAERALVIKYPKKSLKAYKLSHSARNLCLIMFEKIKRNDESNACLHFAWSALLYKNFGLKFSQQILNAHEKDPYQPQEEKEMDLANNRLGLIQAKQLLKENQLNKQAILRAFQKNLKRGNFIVLRKGAKKQKTLKKGDNR